MKVVSTELRQVFRAYTKQLRGEYDQSRSSAGRESVAKGFERVDISPEARALAQSLTETASTGTKVVGNDRDSKVSEEKDSNEDEKNSSIPKESEDSSRDKEVVN